MIGQYPDYIAFAEKLGANTFNIADEVYQAMSKAERWAANTKCLDEAIARGDDILLSHPITHVGEATRTFKREVGYLMRKGYDLADGGTRMIPR